MASSSLRFWQGLDEKGLNERDRFSQSSTGSRLANVRKPLLSTSAQKHRGVTIIFNHDYDRIIFSKRDSDFGISRLSFLLARHFDEWNSSLQSVGDGWRVRQMTWMKKSTTTMETREMRLEKLQLVVDEQSPMRIKPDSLIFLVMRKLQDHYVLLNRRDLTNDILRHFEAYGFLNPMIIQCDKEMSIIDVCRKVARERNARRVLQFAPKTSHQSNGFVEAVHGHIQGLARCYQTQIETNTGVLFSAISPAIPFAIRYAGFVLSRFTVRADGRTTFQYLLGTPYVSHLRMFGESVFALIPDHEVRAAKLMNRWISRDALSDEHLVVTKHGLLKCRSVR